MTPPSIDDGIEIPDAVNLNIQNNNRQMLLL
jgi:hypothetical protein